MSFRSPGIPAPPWKGREGKGRRRRDPLPGEAPPACRPPPAARRPPPTAHPAGAARCDRGGTGHGTPGIPRQLARPPKCRGIQNPDDRGRIPPPPTAFPHHPPTAFPTIPPTAFRKITVRTALIKKSGAFLPAHRTCYKGSPGGSTWDAARRSASGPGLRAPPPRRGDRPRPTRKPLGVAPRLPVRHIRVTGDSKSLASIAECSPLCRTSRNRGSISRRHLLTRLDAPERGRIRP